MFCVLFITLYYVPFTYVMIYYGVFLGFLQGIPPYFQNPFFLKKTHTHTFQAKGNEVYLTLHYQKFSKPENPKPSH